METLPKIPMITTPRLVLRPFTMNDRDVLFAIVQEPDIFRYFPTQEAWPLEKVERYINYQIAHWKKFNYGHWAVVMRETGQIIGWNGLEYLPDTDETEVGYLISMAFWGNGYATESASAIVKFGINKIGLKEIIGLTHPQNFASQRVLEKSGLSFTRSAFYFGMDMFRYAIQASV
ncbi:MAG: GNAT family N-acetyltransferase [Chloroflexi bacterium]|nr:GNAT family N-acetyltransferase [Chloroflexota bacterium]